MSAYMVSKEHIDRLVQVAIEGPSGVAVEPGRGWWPPYFKGERIYFDDADRIGQALVCENLASIHARYPDTIDDPDGTPGPIERYWEEPYRHTRHAYRPSVVEALKLIDCYEYQSCEHQGWENSDVRRLLSILYKALVHALDGYDEAPWGI